jgi:hypothetical protein
MSGDGHLEVFEADTGDGLSFVVRALDRALQPRWETRTELAMDGSLAYPAGGPAVADLEGDGSLSVLVSTGRDVLALDARAGTVRWRMLEANPSFDGRLVTGFAAADGDGDDRTGWPGFRVPGTPASGRSPFDSGVARWSQALTNLVVGSPVLTRSGRIAVVETPESSTTSSVLSLLDIVTGDATVRTTTPFWSRFPPASADINGDGAPEYAVVSGDPA